MDGLLVHCIGALQLIEFRGPYSHKTGIEHVIFTEFLPYLVILHISISVTILIKIGHSSYLHSQTYFSSSRGMENDSLVC